MRRYFFRVRYGEVVIPDPEGEEMIDQAAAEAEAIRVARELALQLIGAGEALGEGPVLELMNEENMVVFTVSFLSAIRMRLR